MYCSLIYHYLCKIQCLLLPLKFHEVIPAQFLQHVNNMKEKHPVLCLPPTRKNRKKTLILSKDNCYPFVKLENTTYSKNNLLQARTIFIILN